jgi:hypothetical protein
LKEERGRQGEGDGLAIPKEVNVMTEGRKEVFVQSI